MWRWGCVCAYVWGRVTGGGRAERMLPLLSYHVSGKSLVFTERGIRPRIDQ